jgi:hypothetical protein
MSERIVHAKTNVTEPVLKQKIYQEIEDFINRMATLAADNGYDSVDFMGWGDVAEINFITKQ